jgi:hypothetical protein
MQTVRKYLVYEYVPIIEKTFSIGARESCVAQRSIYVVLRGNEETRSCINQVRNVLRYLLFCYCICALVIKFNAQFFELPYLIDMFEAFLK